MLIGIVGSFAWRPAVRLYGFRQHRVDDRLRCTVLVLLLFACFSCHRETSQAELARVRAAGDRIVQEVEAYKRRVGRYPKSLDEARIENVRTPIGEFAYEVENPGHPDEHFILRAGSYKVDGYTIFWNSERRLWDSDE